MAAVAAFTGLSASAQADHTLNTFSGTVTGPGVEGPVPLEGICVKTYRQSDGALVDEVMTDASGGYHTTTLAAGDYRVEFSDCDGLYNVVDEWYLDKPDFDSADTVTIVHATTKGGIDAELAEGGTISGAVTDTSTALLSGICVGAYDGSQSLVRSATTDDGDYTIEGLPTGDFRVEFTDCSAIHNTLDEWFDDERNFAGATLVPVTAGESTPEIDAVLSAAGSISGTVTDSSPAPLGGICVGAYDGSQSLLSSATTNGAGDYTIGGLPAGSFRVEFTDCGDSYNVLDEWYDDAAGFGGATPVGVTAGTDSSGIDAELAPGGSISGKVTDSAMAELDGICVEAYDGSFAHARSTTTNATGDYTLVGLPSGDFRVEFIDCGDTHGVFDEWFDDQQSFDDATDVAVVAGVVTPAINAELTKGGSISGTVTDSSMTALGGICVGAYDAAQALLRSATTNGAGAYTIAGLPAGSFRVKFTDCASSYNVLDEWYDDAAGFGGATPVGVTAGTDSPGIDAELAAGGSIAGTVTDGSMAALAGICVAAYDATPALVRSATTNGAGEYEIRGLPTGDFRVEFTDCNDLHGVLSEWFDDQQSLAAANDVGVVVGAVTPLIDAVLEEPGSIAGKVTDSSMAALANICVAAYTAADEIAAEGTTNGIGEYKIGGLRAGDFRVEFTDCGNNHNVFGEWYADQQSFDDATAVAVAAGAETPGIDAELAKGGSISGKVTDESSMDELEGVCVELYDLGQSLVGSAVTDSRGDYKIKGLVAGSYRLKFVDCNDTNTINEWYMDKTGFANATDVAVAAGAETPGIDAELAKGGSISGKVTDSSMAALAGVCVELYDLGGALVGTTLTNAQGSYSFRRLGGGSYRVEFADCPENANLEAEWYDDRAGFEEAVDVPVTLGANTAGIDAELAADTTPPNTIIDSGPADGSTILTAEASFTFHGDPAGDTAKIQCKLDSASYADCTSPKTFSGLANGSHTVAFRAEDAAGNKDASPASSTFTVATSSPDTTPPDTIIDSGPAEASTITTDSADFAFHGEPAGDTAKIQCKLDSGSYTDCTSPRTISSLSDGVHTVRFRAEDALGNQDPTPAVRNFKVDTSSQRGACEEAKNRVSFAKIPVRKAKKAVRKAKKALRAAKRQGNARDVKRARKRLEKRRAWKRRAVRKLREARALRDEACA